MPTLRIVTHGILLTVLEKHDHIILFDGVCNLCNGSVNTVIKLDRKKRFRFLALQSEKATEILGGKIDPAGYASFIYLRNGHMLQRSTAALNVLRDLGFPWSIFYLFIFLPCFIRDGAYNFIARNRYRLFGKRDTCMVPNEELNSRFL